MKQKQWRKASNRVFRANQDVDKAYRLVFGPTNKAGCVICGEDDPSVLDIHESDNSNDFRVLCNSCRCNLSEKYNKIEARVDQ